MSQGRFRFNDLFQKWGLSNIKLNVFFAELEFVPTEDDQTAAWDMYVELLTRISTQRLEDNTGDEETALNSIYALFGITRTILKEKGRNAPNFTKIAVIVLNQIIRPFTARWHIKKLQGAFSNNNECNIFRNELYQLQIQLRGYTGMLAELAMVEDLTKLTDDTTKQNK